MFLSIFDTDSNILNHAIEFIGVIGEWVQAILLSLGEIKIVVETAFFVLLALSILKIVGYGNQDGGNTN